MSSGSRVDLHIHSRHSTRSGDWLLRRFDFPASYTDPLALHSRLTEAGMNFVTITDHNTIAGCLEIAHLGNVFISEEVTAHFPEDGSMVHLLVWGITESQHAEIQKLRENIYDLRGYLAANQIAHAVAHLFHSPDEKLNAANLQKLILLFKHFEVVNGRYSGLLSRSAHQALEKITPRRIEQFVAKLGIDPTHDEPWKKIFVGGSDDHGGVFPARAFTQTPGAATYADFLKNLREGRCEPKGQNGTPLTLAHSTYSTAFYFLKDKMSIRPDAPGTALVEKIFSRFMEGKDPTEFSFAEKFGFVMQGLATGKIFELAKVGNSSLWKEMSAYFSRPEVKAALARETAGVEEPERRAFLMANLIANQLGFRFFSQFMTQITAGKLLESIQMISPVVPIAGLLSPYFRSFHMPKRQVLRDLSTAACGEVVPELRNIKRAWFTDTLEDVNGVATTIRRMVSAGVAAGHDVVVVTSRSEVAMTDIPIQNFPPIGEFELPEYELQRLSFPPFLQILDYIASNNFSELIISTPGPVGLSALLAAKLLGLPSVSIYHTDFPQYVRILTEDSFMETLTWNFMHWFYSQQEVVYVNSQDYRKALADRGIPLDRLKILPRGLDTKLFHPTRRDVAYWRDRGLAEGEVGVLFVGRVSKEKNLDVLVAAASKLAKNVRLLFVGDGPYMKELRRLLPNAIFTGYQTGSDLARAYAAADIFAFPSTTDTFGNVILEAQASGLPCIVTDVGGPRDLVENGVDGFVTRALDVGQLVKAINTLAEEAPLRSEFALASRKKIESRDWSRAFEAFWAASPE